jgi:hypothetical protein
VVGKRGHGEQGGYRENFLNFFVWERGEGRAVTPYALFGLKKRGGEGEKEGEKGKKEGDSFVFAVKKTVIFSQNGYP